MNKRLDEIEKLNIKVSNILMLETNIPVENVVDITLKIDAIYKPYIKY